jgi:hypothetical protein
MQLACEDGKHAGQGNFPFFARGQLIMAQISTALARVKGGPSAFSVNLGGTAITLGKWSGAFTHNTLAVGDVPIVTVDPKLAAGLVDLWLIAQYSLGAGS